MTTVRPRTATTQPPSTSECAYSDLLAVIRENAKRTNAAFAVALTLDGLDPSCKAELAPRLYEVITNE